MEERILTSKDLKKGMKARVSTVDETDELCPRLLELGLTPGVEFEVVKVAPFGDPIEINVRGYRLCVRRSEVGCLRLVELD
ncbi:MAG: ferrous iron transport protein A [Fimbriimonadaceae bacterium]